MDYAENLAKAIMEVVHPGATMHFQTDQSTGRHDFNLEYSDGGVAAVEVTTSTEQSQEATVAAITDPRKGGASIKTKLCQKDWYIHPLPNANINRIRALADEYLYVIETDDLEHFFSGMDAGYHSSVDRIYNELGIESGRVARWKVPGQIRIATPGGGGFVMPENLQKAIESEASKPDNCKKLGLADTSERHLFVYVSSLNFLAWAALIEGDMPSEPPELPNEITDVWAVTGAGRKDQYVVWKATREARWQNVGLISLNR
jgi:hypothetical protein